VDFVCFDAKLVIELDGSQHAMPENVEGDRIRTDFLEAEGFSVLRIWNVEFMQNTEGVLETIRLALESTPHPHRRGG
jgi:very-short-patch-repair endonuclease